MPIICVRIDPKKPRPCRPAARNWLTRRVQRWSTFANTKKNTHILTHGRYVSVCDWCEMLFHGWLGNCRVLCVNTQRDNSWIPVCAACKVQVVHKPNNKTTQTHEQTNKKRLPWDERERSHIAYITHQWHIQTQGTTRTANSDYACTQLPMLRAPHEDVISARTNTKTCTTILSVKYMIWYDRKLCSLPMCIAEPSKIESCAGNPRLIANAFINRSYIHIYRI